MNTEEIGFIIIVAVLVVMYFVMIRPMQQEQKRHQHTIRDLRVGDEVITTAGFFARVKQIETPETGPVQLLLDLGNGIEVRAVTSAVAKRVTPAVEPAELPEQAKGT
jgi:preprotein translocase subunit YajC